MKKLTTYLKDNESSLISLNEKLIVNKNYKQYIYAPKSFNELREIIEDRYDKLGPGTEQNPIDFNDIDVSNIDSFYNKDNVKGIFEVTKFEYIDISNWDVSSVKNMSWVFYNCKKLESVGDLSNWDVSKVENMEEMFCDCNNLKSVGDLSNWDVSKVENMGDMFCRCKELKSVGDLSNWDVSNVEEISNMFFNCKKLTSTGDLSKWDVSNLDTFNMYNMFYDSGITNTPSWYKR